MRPHRRLVVAGMVAAVLTLATAAPAHAAGASGVDAVGSTLFVRAASGAVNTFHMYSSPTNFTIYDSTSPLQLDPGRSGGCAQTHASVIVCPLSITRVFYNLGDLDDRIQNDTNRQLTVYAGGGNDTVLGGSDFDEMDGSIGNDWLEGRGGNDYLFGNDGEDDLYGGDGNDRMEGGIQRDEVHGEAGDDTLMSVDALDRLLGSFGNDTIENSDYVDAGWDNDTIIVRHGGRGNLYGSDGYDTLDYTGWQVAVYVTLDGNGNDGTKANACEAPIGCPVPAYPAHNAHGDFERIYGSAQGDRLAGNNEPDHIYGGAGNDSIFGWGGDDVLDAQDGTDQSTHGGSGEDICLAAGSVTRLYCEIW